ncbi:hypothetical protein BLA15816_04274 [Burkholderia lata]|nr:hypothetical protein BLA15816_04274 [Burkholderia lata]
MPHKVGSSSSAQTYYAQTTDSAAARSEPESRRSRRSSSSVFSGLPPRHDSVSERASRDNNWQEDLATSIFGPSYQNLSLHSQSVGESSRGSESSYVTADAKSFSDRRSETGSVRSDSSISHVLSEAGSRPSSLSARSSLSSNGSHLPLSSHASDASARLSGAGNGSHLSMSTHPSDNSSGPGSRHYSLPSFSSVEYARRSLNGSEKEALRDALEGGRMGGMRRRGSVLASETASRTSSEERAELLERLNAARKFVDVEVPVSAVSSITRQSMLDDLWVTASDVYTNTESLASESAPSRTAPTAPASTQSSGQSDLGSLSTDSRASGPPPSRRVPTRPASTWVPQLSTVSEGSGSPPDRFAPVPTSAVRTRRSMWNWRK